MRDLLIKCEELANKAVTFIREGLFNIKRSIRCLLKFDLNLKLIKRGTPVAINGDYNQTAPTEKYRVRTLSVQTL